MPENCPYYLNFKCPYAGMYLGISPCSNCFYGEIN